MLRSTLLFFVGVLPICHVQAAEEPSVRVAILQNASSLRLTMPGACRLTDLKGKLLSAWPSLKWQEIKAGTGGIMIGGKGMPDPVVLEPVNGEVFHVNARPYRGALILRRTKEGKLTAINRLGLEDYLVGALTSEVSAGWPMESLKAHAVVSRTMTAHRIWISKGKEFDMTADTSTHMYYGVAAERGRTREAVEATRGQVMAWEGELFSASFHASCGGHTENVAELWSVKKPLPPLAGAEDPHCKNLKHYQWKASIAEKEFLQLLGDEAQKLGSLQEVSVGERNRSGRVRVLRMKGENGSLSLTGRQVREKLGANRLRSLKFKVTADSGKVIFDGFGWGHGVGLCQWGAYGMSKAGRTMEEILPFYFPGAQRRKLKGLPGYS